MTMGGGFGDEMVVDPMMMGATRRPPTPHENTAAAAVRSNTVSCGAGRGARPRLLETLSLLLNFGADPNLQASIHSITFLQ